MNQHLFACRNLADKIRKVLRHPSTLLFYLKTYVFSRFKHVEPDVYIVSYPKCGRTWLRVIFQKYLMCVGDYDEGRADKSLYTFPGGVKILFDHDQGNWVPSPRTREQLQFRFSKYAGARVVFLARDPRDVLVSSYYHLRYREHIFREGLDAFVRDELVGAHKLAAFMNMWMENRDVPENFRLLTYENLHEDPLSHVRDLLLFAGVKVDEGALEKAVEDSSFDKMKRMEKSGTLKEPWMRPGSKSGEEAMKIRKGKVGGYREELSEEDVAYLDSVVENELSDEFPYHANAS